jgi:hypothetical protein
LITHDYRKASQARDKQGGEWWLPLGRYRPAAAPDNISALYTALSLNLDGVFRSTS